MLDATEFGKAMAAIVKEATAPLLKRIEELEARQPEKGEKGEPGKDAEPIETADVVRELIACPEIGPILALQAAEAVAKHIEANPIRHGENGKDGAPGKDGSHGEKGEPGPVGKDGAGIADLLIDREGALVATMTDGRVKSLGVVVGKDGERGKDGMDLSDVSIDYDGHRTVTVKAKGGEVAKSYVLGIPMDAGYWREGADAAKGDVMTHAGNAWIALRETKAKPCLENSQDWRLFARRGKDGTDGRNGRDLGPTPPVKLQGAGNE